MDEKQILAGYSPDEEKPVLSYAVLMSVFSASPELLPCGFGAPAGSCQSEWKPASWP